MEARPVDADGDVALSPIRCVHLQPSAKDFCPSILRKVVRSNILTVLQIRLGVLIIVSMELGGRIPKGAWGKFS